MATHTTSEEDPAFRAAFEACAVAPAAFNHEAHLRLAEALLSGGFVFARGSSVLR